MSEPPPADDRTSPPPQPQAVRAALASLPVPEATDEFWDQLDQELDGEAPLQLTPRPAVRPITQPPPAAGTPTPADDIFERGGHRRSVVGRRPRGLPSLVGDGLTSGTSSRKRLVVLAVLGGLVALAALGGLFGEDGDDDEADVGTEGRAPADEEADAEAEGDEGDEEAASENGEAGTDEDAPEATTTTTIPTPRGMEADVPLRAGGVGLLETGSMTLQDVARVTGVEPEVNEVAFTASGGNCFDGVLPGADDLTLWFRSPDAGGLDDPAGSVLSALSIDGSSNSLRSTDAGFSLGTHELELYTHYDRRLTQHPNPFHPDGSIWVAADDQSDNAIGYVTGNGQVLEIRVGHEPLVTRANLCQL